MYAIETETGMIFTELIPHFEALLRYLRTESAVALYSVDGAGNLHLELSRSEEAIFLA